jgi:predicted SAM-dependent methyltransferase
MQDNKKILNVGAGEKPLNDAINLDRVILPGIDYICDIVKEDLPFIGESFDEIIADYVLCQICNPNDFIHVINEFHRVLRPDGLLKIKVPDARYPCAFQDPMDCRYFVKETFDYFNEEHYRYKMFHYGFFPWKVIKVEKEREDRLYAELKKV